MSIPRMKSDDLKQYIREDVINAMARKVNQQFEPVVDLGLGFLCIVDTRIFPFTTTNIGPSPEDPNINTNLATFDLDLDPDEYPVRAVVRTFRTAENTGLYERAAATEYDRAAKKLFVDTGNKQGPGTVYVELWKQIRK